MKREKIRAAARGKRKCLNRQRVKIKTAQKVKKTCEISALFFIKRFICRFLTENAAYKLEKKQKMRYNRDRKAKKVGVRAQMRTGIFGGSFDPVHAEHVALVKAAIDTLRLDRVFVLPAYVPPHKRGRVLTDDVQRVAMLKKAFACEEKAVVCEYELEQGGVSYTYLTCEHFKAVYPSDELYFLMGTDMLRDFPTWKNPERILQLCTIAVCDRAEKDKDWAEEEEKRFFSRFQKTFEKIEYTARAVSSTEVRVLAAAGEDVSALCGREVAAYIKENGLYEIKNAKAALANEKEERKAHSLRVAVAAAKKAVQLGVDERLAMTAALFHDCAKNLQSDSPLLKGFLLPQGVPVPVPQPVLHQFTGAYVAENAFGITDQDVLNAVRYHTSGRENMSILEQIVFLADMVEDGRDYDVAERLRRLYYAEEGGLDFTTFEALRETLYYLEKKGDVYPLTRMAYEYLEKKLAKQ